MFICGQDSVYSHTLPWQVKIPGKFPREDSARSRVHQIKQAEPLFEAISKSRRYMEEGMFFLKFLTHKIHSQ